MKIKVKAHTNSKNEKVILNNDETLDIYIQESPVKGKANKRLIEILGNYFHVKKNQIELVYGAKNKLKIFEITT